MIPFAHVNQSLSRPRLESGAMDDTAFTAPTAPADRPRDPRAAARSARKIPLPAPGTQRWVVRRKAAVVEAVKTGQLALEDACRVYGITAEELQGWQRLLENHGTRGLRVTRLKDYRAQNLSQIKG